MDFDTFELVAGIVGGVLASLLAVGWTWIDDARDVEPEPEPTPEPTVREPDSPLLPVLPLDKVLLPGTQGPLRVTDPVGMAAVDAAWARRDRKLVGLPDGADRGALLHLKVARREADPDRYELMLFAEEAVEVTVQEGGAEVRSVDWADDVDADLDGLRDDLVDHMVRAGTVSEGDRDSVRANLGPLPPRLLAGLGSNVVDLDAGLRLQLLQQGSTQAVLDAVQAALTTPAE